MYPQTTLHRPDALKQGFMNISTMIDQKEERKTPPKTTTASETTTKNEQDAESDKSRSNTPKSDTETTMRGRYYIY